MWTITTGGFTSAVQHRDDHSMAMVRARDKKSLEEMMSSIRHAFEEQGGKTSEELDAIMAEMPIYSVPGDYKWRAVVPKVVYAMFLTYETMTYLNYSNFKSKLESTRGTKWHDAAMKVWTAMHMVTDYGEKTGNPEVDNPAPLSSKYGTSYPGSSAWGDPNYDTSAGFSDDTWGESKYPKGGSEDDAEPKDIWVGSESLTDSVEYSDDDYEYFTYDKASDTYTKVRRDWGAGEDDYYMKEYYPSGTDGYHTFSGKDFTYEGSDDISIAADAERGGYDEGDAWERDWEQEDGDLAPTDAELEQIQELIDDSWEPWDPYTDYNTVTGETRDAVGGLNSGKSARRGIHSLTDSEWERSVEHGGLGGF